MEAMNEVAPLRRETVLREGSMMESYKWRQPDIEVTALQQEKDLSDQCQDVTSCISVSVVEQLEEDLEATFQLEDRCLGLEAGAAAFKFGIDLVKMKAKDMNMVLIF